MDWALIERIIYIGIKAVIFTGIVIGLIISACVFVHFIVTRGWSDEVKTPRSWRKRERVMSEKWGEEWDKLERIKARRK